MNWDIGCKLIGAKIALLIALLILLGQSACSTPNLNDVVVEGRRPELVFASDSDSSKLQALFADPSLIPELKDLRAGIALSLEDLSPERTHIVQRLNDAGIPVTAWMALPHEQGYYLNADNAPEAENRFSEFEQWTRYNKLSWAAIGLDIEPSLGDWSQIQGHRWHFARTLLGRAFNGQKVAQARNAYQALIREMQAHGYVVQTYQLLFLADERRAHTTVLERLFGIVDVRGNDEALMVYSSFNHGMGGAMVWAYGPDALSIAVGSTASTGSAQTDAKFGPLNWDEFSRDLIVASHFSRLVGVYNLEGCVRQGFLPRLKNLDWQQPATLPAAAIARAEKFRSRVQAVLWVASHIVYLGIAGLLLIAVVLAWWLRTRKAKRLEGSPQIR